MSRKAKTNGSTSLATIPNALSAQITRAEANDLLKARALELFHTVLADLQRIQARLAAIAARQQRATATGGEPKVAKFVEQVGTMIVGY